MTEMPKKTSRKFSEYKLSTFPPSVWLGLSASASTTVSLFLFLFLPTSLSLSHQSVTAHPWCGTGYLSICLCLPFHPPPASLWLQPAPQPLYLLCLPGLFLTLRPPHTRIGYYFVLSGIQLNRDLREISGELVDLGTTDTVTCPHQQ